MFISISEKSQTHTIRLGGFILGCQELTYLSRAEPRIEETLASKGEFSHSLLSREVID
jgi:hypothetical protein